MTFRNENTATAIAENTQAGSKRNRLRMAIMGGALVALPVAGLVTATTASAATTSTWDAVAQCESTGNWSINSGNGFSGGLQFTPSTWAAYGGTQYAASAYQATEAQQISVAEKVLADQGPGAWPVCSVKAGLTAGGAPAAVNTSSVSSSAPAAKAATAPKATAPSTPAASSAGNQSTDTKPSTAAKPSTDGKSSTDTTSSAKAAAKPAADKPATTGGTYTVKSGDTLSAIAAAHGTSVANLYGHNVKVVGGNPDMILPGQVLTV